MVGRALSEPLTFGRSIHAAVRHATSSDADPLQLAEDHFRLDSDDRSMRCSPRLAVRRMIADRALRVKFA